jgi:hypothetical protein
MPAVNTVAAEPIIMCSSAVVWSCPYCSGMMTLPLGMTSVNWKLYYTSQSGGKARSIRGEGGADCRRGGLSAVACDMKRTWVSLCKCQVGSGRRIARLGNFGRTEEALSPLDKPLPVPHETADLDDVAEHTILDEGCSCVVHCSAGRCTLV